VKASEAWSRPGATSNGSAFGRLLKDWRGRRGLSQLDLALATRTTQRHVSFIESGRATPSREMIVRLAATYGSIFGTVMLAAILGGAAGPWIAGVSYDLTGTYSTAFCIAAGCSLISILAIWLAAPGTVRAVAGRAQRLPTSCHSQHRLRSGPFD